GHVPQGEVCRLRRTVVAEQPEVLVRRVRALVPKPVPDERSGEGAERAVPPTGVVVAQLLGLRRLTEVPGAGAGGRAHLGTPHLLRTVTVGDHDVVDVAGLPVRVPRLVDQRTE